MFSKNQLLLSEKLKTLTSFNYHRVQYFLLKRCTRSLLTTAYKRVFEIFLILFRSWVISKNQKRTGFYTFVFYIFINNSKVKQNPKITEHPFGDIFKYAKFHYYVCKISAKNIKLCGSCSWSKIQYWDI